MRQTLIALDQLINTLLGGLATETLSARAYREKRHMLVRAINWLFRDPDHCENAFLASDRRDKDIQFYQSEL